jgi:murein DD-endopeptidase MepM/ murein hydrolase activator NlpD
LRFRTREDYLYRFGGLSVAAAVVALAVNYVVFLSPTPVDGPALDERLKVLKETTVAQAEAPQANPATPPAAVEAMPDGDLVEGSFVRGDTIVSVLKAAGLDSATTQPLVAGMQGVFDFRTLKEGDRYRLQVRDGQLVGLEISTSPLDVYVARRSEDATGQVEVAKRKVDTVRSVARLGCAITDSVEASILHCGGTEKLAARVIDLLSSTLDFYTDIRYGDELRVVVEKVFVGDQFVDFDRILAVEYAGKVHHQAAFRYEAPDGDWEYYDASGESLQRMFLHSPLKYRRVSSGFNPKRYHPILHQWKAHMAVDYAAPSGTPVWAYAGGVVSYAGRAGASGNLVVVKHKDGFSTSYAHLKSFARKLKAGDRVNQGDVIGYVGSTGRSTGPHLHFALARNGAPLNPFTVSNPPLTKLTDAYRKHFDEVVRKLQEQLDNIPIDDQGARRTS